MPDISSLCANTYTKKQWLNYYKNVWTRNLMARAIDVQTDATLKAKNPEEIVQTDDQRQVPVKERLEIRKMLVQDALDLIVGIDALLIIAEKDNEFQTLVLSPEALAVAKDMIPVKAGDECKTDDGKDGRQEITAPGKYTCIPKDQSVEEFLKAKVEAEARGEGKQIA
jgi:hypothetical protein